jgi:valyl-tRNA synthetase
MRAVRSKITIAPARFEKTFFQWMENIHDWNISRQIWWGHRLPVWYRTRNGVEEIRVSPTSPGPTWTQDTDTLDTWFSSGLWTFSSLGWPKRTSDLKRFHPTLLVTG